MINVVGIKTRVWGRTPVLKEMCVCPPSRWNIWNMNIYKKNIYKKQIDKKYHSITPDRNTLEYIGTIFQSLFQKCSVTGICLNTPQRLAVQGLQQFSRKRCSTMFRLIVPRGCPTESPVIRGLAVINF